MRVIKFEYGFESVNGTIKKVYHLHEIPHIQHKCDVWKVLKTKYVRQFTGLKDKNDVDIYEGDIVKTSKGITKVTYKLGCFYAITCSHYRLGGWKKDSIEVIGNIYDNAELLNGTIQTIV